MMFVFPFQKLGYFETCQLVFSFQHPFIILESIFLLLTIIFRHISSIVVTYKNIKSRRLGLCPKEGGNLSLTMLWYVIIAMYTFHYKI